MLAAGAAGAAGLRASGGEGRPVWLDHDGGWEDIVALLVLLRSPDVEVKGVAITPGIAEAKLAVERTRMLLGELYVRDVEIVDEVPAGADLLVTGPLTRVGRMLTKGQAPKSVTWMGGAVRVPGNVNQAAEWNAQADAKALGALFASAVPVTLCPLDLTNQFPAKAEVVGNARTPVQKAVAAAYGEKERYWWDELAAGALAAPGLFARRTERIRVEASGRMVPEAGGKAVTVLRECERVGFENLLRAAFRY